MYEQELNLPINPIGDLILDIGGDAEAGDIVTIEAGDIEEELGDYDETGGKISFGRSTARAAKKGKISKRLLSKLQTKNPRAARQLPALAKARAAARTAWAQYEYVEGMRTIATSLGIGRRLKPYEIPALKNSVMDTPAVEPQVMPFVVAGSTATLELDAALVSVFGLTPGTLFRYVGVKIMIVASDLNKTKGAQLTIQRDFGGLYQLVTTVALSHTHYPTFTAISGRIVAGSPRFSAPYIAASATATGNWSIVVNGVPAGYSLSARFILPGDAEAERFLALL